MTEEEIKKEFKIANYQWDIRVKRAKNFFLLNANVVILQKAMELVEDAGKRIALFAQPYEKIQEKIPEYEGAKIIQEVLENQKHEELMKEADIQWELFKLKLVENVKDASIAEIISNTVETIKIAIRKNPDLF